MLKNTLVVLDGRVTDEKLGELLALQTEHPRLDFKRTIDLASTRGLVEFIKDVGAMQHDGGYIVGGVDLALNLAITARSLHGRS